MTEKRLLILTLMLIITLSCIGVVNATQITMHVDSKHIIGMGNGNTPLDYENWVNVVYVISERQMVGYDHYILQEYPVSIQDYCKIKLGQKVTLEVPNSRIQCCKVVKIE